VRLERLTGTIVEQAYDKAILPMGSTEYHGAHLPYGTDTIAAESYAEAIARELGNTLVLPALDYGVSPHHLGFKWTLTLRPDTLTLVVRDIGESLVHHDIRKLLIVTAHDSNPQPAMNAARMLSQDHELTVAVFNNGQARSRALLAGTWDIDLDHGGESEMSLVLYGAPETARLDLAVNRPGLRANLPVDLVGMFHHDRPSGYSGNAAQGSAEEGEAMIKAIAADVAPFIRELDRNGWTRGPWMHEYQKPS
jgi:creatinine amidohydrolase